MHEPTFVPKIKVIYIKIEMNKKMAGQYWIDHYVDLCYEGQSKIKRRKSIKMNWLFDLFILKTYLNLALIHISILKFIVISAK